MATSTVDEFIDQNYEEEMADARNENINNQIVSTSSYHEASTSDDSSSDEELSFERELIRAVEDNNFERLKDLFGTSNYSPTAFVNTRDRNHNNNTLLQKAVKAGRKKNQIDYLEANKEIVKFLIENGANVKLQNDGGLSAMDLASKMAEKDKHSVHWARILEMLKVANNEENGSANGSPVYSGNPTYETSGLKDSLHGLMFQFQLTMLFLYRSSNMYDSFWLAAEMNKAVKFDDVVIKYKRSSQDKRYTWRFLQAKHLMHPDKNRIPMKEIFRNKGKRYFFLLKYFDSFVNITTDQFFKGDDFEEFTICTNTDFHKNCISYFKEVNFQEDRLLFFDNQNSKKYQLDPSAKTEFKEMLKQHEHDPTYNTDSYYIDSFFEKFTFVVNYPDENTLNKLITDELGGTFEYLNANFAITDYKNRVLEWLASCKKDASTDVSKCEFLLLKDGKSFLNKIKSQINIFIANSNSLTYLEELQKNDVKFKPNFSEELIGFIRKNSLHQILYLSTIYPLLSSVKISQYLRSLKQDSYLIYNSDKFKIPKIAELVLKAFSSNTNCKLLVMIFNENNLGEKFIDALIKILLDSKSKKLLIVGLQNDFLERKLLQVKNQLKCSNLQEGFKGLEDLDTNSQKSILQKPIKLQGSPIIWNEILDQNSAKIIDGVVLEKLLIQDEIDIDQNSLPKEKLYVDRTFSRQTLSVKLFQDKELLNSNLFLVCNATEQNLIDLKVNEQYFRSTTSNDKVLTGILVTSTEEAKKVFDLIKSQGNLYCIHYFKQEFYLQEWRGSLKILKNFFQINKITESDFLQPDYLDNKVLLLSGDPGLGKSTFIAKLSRRLKRTNNKLWVKRVILNNYYESLDKINFLENQESEAVCFLADMLFDTKTQYIEKKLFKLALATNCQEVQLLKVILLFDGFDEIAPHYKEKTLILLKALKKSGVCQMWVTTRTNEKSSLEEALNTQSLFMTTLDARQLLEFLEMYKINTTQSKKLNKIVGLNDEIVTQNFKDGNPLHLKMIMKLLVHIPEKELDIGHIKILHLYEKFVDMKYNIYYDEKASIKAFSGAVAIRQDENKVLDETHENVALQVMFPDQLTNLSKIRDMKINLDSGSSIKVGLLVFENVTNTWNFNHRSFAEYFVAKFVVRHISEEIVQSFLFDEVFLGSNNSLIPRFLDENEHFVKSFSASCEERISKMLDKTILVVNYLEYLENEGLNNLLKESLLLALKYKLRWDKTLCANSFSMVKLRWAFELLLVDQKLFENLFQKIFSYNVRDDLCHVTQFLCEIYEGQQMTDIFDKIFQLEKKRFINEDNVELKALMNMMVHKDTILGYTILHSLAERGRFDYICEVLKWVDQKWNNLIHLRTCTSFIKDNRLVLRRVGQCDCNFDDDTDDYSDLKTFMINQENYHGDTFLQEMTYNNSFRGCLDFFFDKFDRDAIINLMKSRAMTDIGVALLQDLKGKFTPAELEIILSNDFYEYCDYFSNSTRGIFFKKLKFCLTYYDHLIVKHSLTFTGDYQSKVLQCLSIRDRKVLQVILNFLETDTCSYQTILKLLFHLDENKQSALHKAVAENDTETNCRILLKFAKDKISRNDLYKLLLLQDDKGYSVLHLAGLDLQLRYLIEFGRENLTDREFRNFINLTDKNQQTFLFKINEPDIFVLLKDALLECIQVTNKYEMTIFHYYLSPAATVMLPALKALKEIHDFTAAKEVLWKVNNIGKTALHYFFSEDIDNENYLYILSFINYFDKDRLCEKLMIKDEDGITTFQYVLTHNFRNSEKIGTELFVDWSSKNCNISDSCMRRNPVDELLQTLKSKLKQSELERLVLNSNNFKTLQTANTYSSIMKMNFPMRNFVRYCFENCQNLILENFFTTLSLVNGQSTLLHWTVDFPKTMQYILHFMKENKWSQPSIRKLLFQLDKKQQSALQKSVINPDTCKMLLNFARDNLQTNTDFSALMLHQDIEKKTILHLSCSPNSSESNIEYLFKYCKKYLLKEEFVKLLKITDMESKTIFHYLVKKELNQGVLERMLRQIIADEKWLEAKVLLSVSNLGKTVFHYSSKECFSSTYLCFLQIFMENCTAADLEDTLKLKDEKGYTIFQNVLTHNYSDFDKVDITNTDFMENQSSTVSNQLNHSNTVVMFLQKLKSKLAESEFESMTLKQCNFKYVHDNTEVSEGENIPFLNFLKLCLKVLNPQTIVNFLGSTNNGQENLLHLSSTHENSLKALLRFMENYFLPENIKNYLFLVDDAQCTVLHRIVKKTDSVNSCKMLLDFAKNNMPESEFCRFLLLQDSEGLSVLHISCGESPPSPAYSSCYLDSKFMDSTDSESSSPPTFNSILDHDTIEFTDSTDSESSYPSLRVSVGEKFTSNPTCSLLLEYSKNNLPCDEFQRFINLTDQNGKTFLFYSNVPGDTFSLLNEHLLECINLVDQNDTTVWRYYVDREYYYDVSVMKEALRVLKLTCQIEAIKECLLKVNKSGKTALHYAVPVRKSNNFQSLLNFCLKEFDSFTADDLYLLRLFRSRLTFNPDYSS